MKAYHKIAIILAGLFITFCIVVDHYFIHERPSKEELKASYQGLYDDWRERMRADTSFNNDEFGIVLSKCFNSFFYASDRFTYNSGDYWQTPREFVDNDCHGDCEDFAILRMVVLRKFGYPYPIKVLVVLRYDNIRHAILKVKYPNGEYGQFDYGNTPQWEQVLEYLFNQPLFEFNEEGITYF